MGNKTTKAKKYSTEIENADSITPCTAYQQNNESPVNFDYGKFEDENNSSGKNKVKTQQSFYFPAA